MKKVGPVQLYVIREDRGLTRGYLRKHNILCDLAFLVTIEAKMQVVHLILQYSSTANGLEEHGGYPC